MTSQSSPEAPSPPGFPDSYHRAHRAYAGVAGLLLAWEVVGVKLDSSRFGVALESPGSAPMVLSVLVFYFGIRFTVEWFQSDARRRAMFVSLVDVLMAHLIGLGSLAVFLIQQRFAPFRIADAVTPQTPSSGLLGVVSGFALSEIVRYLKEGQTDRLRLGLFALAFVVPLPIALVGQASAAVFGLASGLAVGLFLWRVLRKKRLTSYYAARPASPPAPPPETPTTPDPGQPPGR